MKEKQALYLVAAHMERLSFGKCVDQIFVQLPQPYVCVIVNRVKLSAGRLYAVIPPRVITKTSNHISVAGFLAPLPSVTRVRRRVDFHDNSDSSDQRVPKEILNIVVWIYFLGTVRTVSKFKKMHSSYFSTLKVV